MEETRPMVIWTEIAKLTDDEFKMLELYVLAEKRWREKNGEVVLAD